MLGMQGILIHGSSVKMVKVSYCYDSVTSFFVDGEEQGWIKWTLSSERDHSCVYSA